MDSVPVFSNLSSRFRVEVAKLARVYLVFVHHLLVSDEVADLCGLVITLVALVPHPQVD